MSSESFGTWLHQAYGVPWRKDDVNERVKSMSETEYNLWIDSAVLMLRMIPSYTQSTFVISPVGLLDRNQACRSAKVENAL